MRRVIVITLFAVVALAGCVPVRAGVDESKLDDRLQAKTQLSSTGGITLLPRYVGADDLSACIAEKLKHSRLGHRYYPESRFRDETFPWFEPGVAPADPKALATVVGRPLVRESLAATGVRYLISLEGRAIEFKERVYGGYAYQKSASLSATLFDLQELRSLGTVGGSASGSEYSLVILPVLVVAPVQTEVCAAVAERLIAFLGGGDADPATN
jgi:hypothetical protein